MTTIRLYRHPVARDALVLQVPRLDQWLLGHYGARRREHLRVFAGEPSAAADITGNVQRVMANDAPFYTVMELPGDPTGGILTSMLISFAVSTVIGVIARDIFAPDTPLANRTQESPNNALSERSNRVRIMERVEDIFGTVRSIPSLLMPTYTKYVLNSKVEFFLGCITRGYAQVEDVREAATPLANITGSSAEVYWPFTSPNSGDEPHLRIGDAITDPVLNVARASTADGLLLKARNQGQLSAATEVRVRGPGSAVGDIPLETTEDVIWQMPDQRKPNLSAIATAGQTLTLTMPGTGGSSDGTQEVTYTPAEGTGQPVTFMVADGASSTYTAETTAIFRNLVDGTPITIVGFADPSNQGTLTVASHTDETVTVVETIVDEGQGEHVFISSLTMTVSLGGDPGNPGGVATRVISEVGDGYVTLEGPAQFGPGVVRVPGDAVAIDNGLLSVYTDWIVLPQLDRTEVWVNVIALRGLYQDSGGADKQPLSVTYEVQVECLDTATLEPTGEVETITSTLTGSGTQQLAETLEHVTEWVGPARVRVQRITPHDYDFAGLISDEITLADIYAVAPVARPHFGNKTIVHTVTHTTAAAGAVRQRELNCLASRLLPIWDGAEFSGSFDATGALASGTIAATSRIVDILAAVTVDPKIGARPIEDLDMQQVSQAQQALDDWNTECGQFNYTFDSDAISYEETVQAIASAGFCRAYRQNGQIRLAPDLAQDFPLAVFTHCNKNPDPEAETITRRFANDGEYDGVELAYQDPQTESQETIRLPLDGSYTKLKRIEATGVRSYEQAWLRAQRELQRLRFERLTIETQVTFDARAVLPNSRVEIVDNTVFRAFDGVVLAQDGSQLTLDTDVAFGEEPYSIILKGRDGTPQSLFVFPGSAPNKVMLGEEVLAEPIITEPTPQDGVATTYSLAADSTRGAMAWLVRELSLTDGGDYVKLTCVNYAAEYYAGDFETIPPKASVISDPADAGA
jgi:hypothetical protein